MRNSNTKELTLAAVFIAIILLMAFTSLGYIPLVVINATIIHIPVILGSLFCGPKKGAFLGFTFGLTSFINNTFRSTSLSAFVFSPVLAASMFGTSGIFKSIWICFVPRILVGVVPYFVYVLVNRAMNSEKKNIYAIVLNAAIGIFLAFGIHAFVAKVYSESESSAPAFLSIVLPIIIAVVVFALLTWFGIKKSGIVVSFTYAGVAGAMTNTLLVMFSIYFLYKDAYANALSVASGTVLKVIGGVISFNGVIEAIVAAIIVSALGAVLLKIMPIHGAKEETAIN